MCGNGRDGQPVVAEDEYGDELEQDEVNQWRQAPPPPRDNGGIVGHPPPAFNEGEFDDIQEVQPLPQHYNRRENSHSPRYSPRSRSGSRSPQRGFSPQRGYRPDLEVVALPVYGGPRVEWACPACTFQNAAQTNACEMCATLRV